MQYRYLGRTGLMVSELCMGTMTFGRETDEKDSHKMLDYFAEQGGNFIDSADVYSSGTSEEIVGRWLATKRREDFVVATKVRFSMGDGVNDVGSSRKHIIDGVHASLKRMNTEYIDLYQLHCWDPGTPLEETLSTLDSLVQGGKVRYIGVSNFTSWQLQKAIDLSRHNGWEVFASLQPLYNLLDRSVEWDLLDVCINEGLGVIPWSPLRGGWLTGKYYRGMENPPEDTRIAIADDEGWMEGWSAYNNERTWSVIDTLLEVAKDAGKEPAQVALNWVLNRPGITAPIIGARTMEQLKSNMGAIGWQLSSQQVERLSAASHMNAPYPHDFIAHVVGER